MIERTTTWNASLRKRVAEFADETPHASVFLFSTHSVLSAVLDNPEEHDFSRDDIAQEGGVIWEDELHLTTEVRAIIAAKLVHALVGNAESGYSGPSALSLLCEGRTSQLGLGYYAWEMLLDSHCAINI